MRTEEVQKVDRVVHERSGGANGRAEDVRSTCSAILRLEVREVRVLHVYVDVQDARRLGEHLADARVLVPGSDRVFTLGEHDSNGHAACLDDDSRRDTGRFLTTVLMTDIVDSTHTVARLGDRRWRKLLAEHYADCRARVDDGGGELVNTTGDGILAIFAAPTRAVRAAIGIQAGARESGMAVRAGVHTGECERLADGLAGLAVHIAARICALGDAHEVMTSGTVRDLVSGSLLAFEPRGCHELRGAPGDWTIFRAIDSAEGTPEAPGGARAGQRRAADQWDAPEDEPLSPRSSSNHHRDAGTALGGVAAAPS
jgi:class 3 adenylate cyclase